ncbi:Shedu anti-phage system protein SduA domain-containing protein [Ferrimicrobium sp.]|uniref:Shedu anti-phage system protein SduA domain-containing protein n=1 Tax=Ferrimicrobium sp. TaxID=2926050 RepID=UPI003450CA34
MFRPRGLLIIGSTSQLQEDEQVASFELFRNNQREIDIITFDELRQKIDLMIDLLQNVAR